MAKPSVAWQVQPLATRVGVPSAYALQQRTGLSCNSALRVWRGTATQVDLTTLAHLSNALGCHPADLIATPMTYTACVPVCAPLLWTVDLRCRAWGIANANQLVAATGIAASISRALWTNRCRRTTLRTLDTLCAAFGCTPHMFIGVPTTPH